MKKREILSIIAGLVVAGVFAGCADRDPITPDDGIAPPGVTNETEALKYYALNDEFTVNADQTFSDESMEPADIDALVDPSSEIIPISWGRFVEDVTVTTNATIEPDDTMAVVEVLKDMTGTLRILAKYNEDDTTTFLIEKPFVDHSVRNVVFRRVGNDPTRFWLNWMPVSTSLVDGATVNPPEGQAIAISELQFTRPNGDVITITDPTNFFLRYRWRNMHDRKSATDVPEMSAGQTFTVRATVVSASADTDLVTLRYGFSETARRRTLMDIVSETANGDGTFTRVFETTAQISHHPGFFHAGVVAKTRKTLFNDDPANYSVNWWGMPYRVL